MRQADTEASLVEEQAASRMASTDGGTTLGYKLAGENVLAETPDQQAVEANSQLYCLAFILILCLCRPTSAALVNFQNCLSKGTTDVDPLPLQFVPYFVDAVFNNSNGAYNLNVTIFGNVAGLTTLQPYPLPDDPQWTNDTQYVGKITDLSPTNPTSTASTLQASFDVLSYSPYNPGASRFCESLVQGHCPLAPVFDHNVSHPANLSDPKQLRAFSMAHDLDSAFIFTSISSNTKVITGDASKMTIACVLANVTPDIGDTVRRLVRFLPALVLAFVAAAVATAAIWSPWGSTDVFRFTSNYGRDQDLLRLVTPGFGDCLQYIQFIVLSGSLTLNYPGYYQPVVSAASWSILMFNQSFVSHGPSYPSIQDGIYTVNGTYGLETTSELVGMASSKDIWAGMMIWLLVIIAATIALAQIAFAGQWTYRQITRTLQEDLRSKNMPFSIGNAIRIAFNYFFLPLVSLSMFQFVEARSSSQVTVALAAIVILAVITFALRLFILFAFTRPRSYLFDDLPTVLLYGPLYNTYSDHAAAFTLIPLLLTFMRGIAFGGVQPSGIVQLVILAICEVAFILTLNAFRPFQSPTSMNAIHAVFAIVRLITILLSVAFVPSLAVGNSVRGWIGYVILFLHAAVLFVGFFLHSLQTLVEVIARAAGAGGEEGVGGGAARGGLVKVFGMRQLSRRHPRRPRGSRNSIASDAVFLNHDNDQKSVHMNGSRSRSISTSSAILLSRQNPSEGRQSVALDSMTGARGHSHSSSVAGIPTTPVTGGSQGGFSNSVREQQRDIQGEPSVKAGAIRVKSGEAGTGPWYRPPRQRRTTIEQPSPGTRSRLSWASSDWAKAGSPQSPDQEDDITEAQDGPLMPARDSPSAAHFGTRDRADSAADISERAKVDYATREVDYYYGMRGPALSTGGTRKLKTGPADPTATGPVSSASNWFRSLLGGKSKEKNKGFEVVRSSRMPPPLQTPPGEIALQDQKPYKDDPESATSPHKTRGFELEDEGGAVGAGTIHRPENSPSDSEEQVEGARSDADLGSSDDEEVEPHRASQISQFPPSLPAIDSGPIIELPSRIASKASTKPSRSTRRRGEDETPPDIPRRSSKRTSVSPRVKSRDRDRLAMITPSPPGTPHVSPPGHLHSHTRNISSSLSLSQPDSPAGPSGPAQRPRQSSAQSSARGSRRPSGAAVVSAFSEDLPPTDGASARSASPFQAPSLRGHEGRPSSLGFVQQHRARDTIHLVQPTHPLTQGTIAELVDESRTESPERRD